MKCRLCDSDAIGHKQLWCKKHYRGHTLEKMIIRHGEELGLQKWNEYREKHRIKNTFEYKNKKFGMTKSEFEAFNKSRAVTLENMVKKYGEDIGRKKFNNYVEKQRTSGITLEYFLHKYGNKDGKIKYEKMIKAKTHSIDNYISKYGATLGVKKYEQYCRNKKVGFYSKIANELFSELEKRIGEPCYYGKNEFGLMDIELKTYYKYDFVVQKIKKNIEFNGEVFHPKSKNDLNFKNPYSNISSQEQWTREQRKLTISENFGFEMLYVWENEYRQNKEMIIEKCLTFLNS